MEGDQLPDGPGREKADSDVVRVAGVAERGDAAAGMNTAAVGASAEDAVVAAAEVAPSAGAAAVAEVDAGMAAVGVDGGAAYGAGGMAEVGVEGKGAGYPSEVCGLEGLETWEPAGAYEMENGVRVACTMRVETDRVETCPYRVAEEGVEEPSLQ